MSLGTWKTVFCVILDIFKGFLVWLLCWWFWLSTGFLYGFLDGEISCCFRITEGSPNDCLWYFHYAFFFSLCDFFPFLVNNLIRPAVSIVLYYIIDVCVAVWQWVRVLSGSILHWYSLGLINLVGHLQACILLRWSCNTVWYHTVQYTSASSIDCDVSKSRC